MDRARRSLLLAGAASPLLFHACTFSNAIGRAYAPALWLATPPNSRATYHVFGSVHLGFWRFYPLPEYIEAAWQRSAALFVELEAGRRHDDLVNAFAPYVRQPSGKDLAGEIGQSLFTRLKTVTKADYNTTLRYQRLRPWAVALELQSETDKRLQADHKQGIDAYFTESAYRQKKPVIELETPQDQVLALGSGSSAEQVAALAARIEEVEAGGAVLQQIVEAWRVGDLDALELLRDQHFPKTANVSAYRQRMLFERDDRMAHRLNNHSATTSAEEFFVLVGAFHLVGEKNLLERLRVLGWRVIRAA